MQSVAQQIINQKDYAKFKELVTQMLEDDKLKQTIRAVFIEGEVSKTKFIEMKPLNSDKNLVPAFDLDLQSDQTSEEFIKTRMKEEFGLVENPNQEQLEEIIPSRNINRKSKGKDSLLQKFY